MMPRFQRTSYFSLRNLAFVSKCLFIISLRWKLELQPLEPWNHLERIIRDTTLEEIDIISKEEEEAISQEEVGIKTKTIMMEDLLKMLPNNPSLNRDKSSQWKINLREQRLMSSNKSSRHKASKPRTRSSKKRVLSRELGWFQMWLHLITMTRNLMNWETSCLEI